MGISTVQVRVTGLIQGVGFRPFVYRIALRHRLTGWVRNTNENVLIRISGKPSSIKGFIDSLRKEAPPAASIEDIISEEASTENFPSFEILESHDISEDVTEISPDIAVCDECLRDISMDGNRLDYSFVNCTNCGPRFTIIRDLPYDRPGTTMAGFPMCGECRKEYETITDRRFHAQPVACNTCGPQYELHRRIAPLYAPGNKKTGQDKARLPLEHIRSQPVSREIKSILEQVSGIIDGGGIIAMKGLGGMHLACDAFNKIAVARLRELKNREAKPFAIMFRDLQSAGEYTEISEAEKASLSSWRRPIVLLKVNERGNSPSLAKNLNSGLNLLGIMLPYMPFHYQLFCKLKTMAIVLTSGNFSNEPIIIDNAEALEKFLPLTDAVLLHDRDIFNRTDDSVVRVIAGKERVFRRSRGYAPSPVRTILDTEGIIAFGAELSNTFCAGRGRKAFLSQHIGDLKGLETTLFYEQTLERFTRLFRVKPSLLAADLHPDYISTRTAVGFGTDNLISIQHHHAHIASCMAENKLDEQVIGVAFDGTGYGDDGHTWGSEFLVCGLEGYHREAHLEYLPLPGGDTASEEPWRMAVSWLFRVYGKDFAKLSLPMFKRVKKKDAEMLVKMINRKVNCPLTCGAGRYFDAVASLLGLCQLASFPAEGPMLLESMTVSKCRERYDWSGFPVISLDAALKGMIDDLEKGTSASIIISKFHNTISSVIFETVKRISRKEGLVKVVLSGGVFQNKYLFERTESLLKKSGFEVFSHSAIPANDGGISLGQLAVAAKKRRSCV